MTMVDSPLLPGLNEVHPGSIICIANQLGRSAAQEREECSASSPAAR